MPAMMELLAPPTRLLGNSPDGGDGVVGFWREDGVDGSVGWVIPRRISMPFTTMCVWSERKVGDGLG